MSKKTKIIIIVVISLLAIGGAVLAFLYFNNSTIQPSELSTAISNRRAVNCAIKSQDARQTVTIQADNAWNNIKILRASSILILNSNEIYEWSNTGGTNFKSQDNGETKTDLINELSTQLQANPTDPGSTIECQNPNQNDFSIPDVAFVNKNDNNSFSTSWQTNTFTEQIPRPSVGSIVSSIVSDDSLTVTMTWTLQEAKQYVTTLEQAGFTPIGKTVDSVLMYNYFGAKADSSYSVTVAWQNGNTGGIKVARRTSN